MQNTILSGLIGAIVGSLATIFFTVPATYKTTIHGESGWRKNLLALCSIKQPRISQFLRLRSLVSPFPEKESIDEEITNFCKNNIEKLRNGEQLDQNVADDFRLYAMTLLKKDWIYSKYPYCKCKRNQKITELKDKLKKTMDSDINNK